MVPHALVTLTVSAVLLASNSQVSGLRLLSRRLRLYWLHISHLGLLLLSSLGLQLNLFPPGIGLSSANVRYKVFARKSRISLPIILRY